MEECKGVFGMVKNWVQEKEKGAVLAKLSV